METVDLIVATLAVEIQKRFCIGGYWMLKAFSFQIGAVIFNYGKIVKYVRLWDMFYGVTYCMLLVLDH